MEKIRVGYIGAGRQSTSSIYPSLRYAPIELVASCALTRDQKDAQRVAREYGAREQRYYLGYEKLLEAEHKNLDACMVVVQPPDYHRIIKDVLSLGLPVWCEKPAASSVEEAKDLEAASQRAGKPLMVGYMKRFATAYRMAKEAMSRAEFGRPTSFYCEFMVGGGIYPDEYTYIVDNPIHIVDLARYFMGEVERVNVEKAEWGEKSWSYAVTLRFTSGALGLLQFGNTQSWRQHNEFAEITGQGRSVSVDNVVRYQYRGQDGPGEMWEPNFTVPIERNSSLILTGYASQLIHFAEVVRDGVTPQVTISDARRALELIDEIYVKGGGVLEPGKKAAAW